MIFAKIHPLLVHFPVALFVSGVLLILYGKLQKEETVQVAGQFNIRFGFWCALVTLSVGILAVINMEIKDKFREMLGFHMMFAFSTVTLFGVALILYLFRQKLWARVLYHLVMVCGLFSTLATGYCGGELVHRFGVATLHLTD